MQWCSDTGPQKDGTVHVWPKSEEREHVLHGTGCECIPKIRRYKTGRILVTHHSFAEIVKRRKNQ